MCIGVIGPVLSAAGSIFGVIQQSQQQKAQAKVYKNQAQIERDKAALEAGRLRKQAGALAGRQRNLFLAQGVDLSGTAEDVILDSTKETEFDAQIIEYGGAVNSQNLETRAKLLRSSAKGTLFGGFLGALTPFINSAQNSASLSPVVT